MKSELKQSNHSPQSASGTLRPFHLLSFSFHLSHRKTHQAFTLIEILVVLSIITLMLGISIISISGIKDEDRLRRAVAMIETTARDNLLQAVKTQQLVTMPLAAGSFGTGSDFSGMLKVRRVGERGFREPKRGETWEFSPTGICEPIEVRLSGPGGTVELAFDALTACAKRKSLDFNAKS